MKKRIIAIDGYSSCGKSTFAQLIAARLGYVFIDTGAMYRAVSLYAVERGLSNEELLVALDGVLVEFRFSETLGRSEVYLCGVNVDGAIRGVEVSERVSSVAGLSAVRSKLVDMQRAMGQSGGVVMDGRDIGTVVFPDADIKLFMTADVGVRARRRYEQLGGSVPLADIERNISERDYADQTRADSPLVRADDAVLLDNSSMSLEEQMLFFDRLFSEL